MEDPQYIYLKIAIDGEGNSELVGAWEGEPQVETKGLGSVFPCRNHPGCYCIRRGNQEIPVYCPGAATSGEKSS